MRVFLGLPPKVIFYQYKEFEKANIDNLSDNFTHLTNYAINKLNENFNHNETEGHKRPLTATFADKDDLNHVMGQIK